MVSPASVSPSPLRTLSCRRRTNHATASVRRRYANAPAVCARCVHVKDQVRVAWKGGFSKGPPRFRSAVNGTALASVSPRARWAVPRDFQSATGSRPARLSSWRCTSTTLLICTHLLSLFDTRALFSKPCKSAHCTRDCVNHSQRCAQRPRFPARSNLPGRAICPTLQCSACWAPTVAASFGRNEG